MRSLVVLCLCIISQPIQCVRNFNLSSIKEYSIFSGDPTTVVTSAPTITIPGGSYSWLNNSISVYSPTNNPLELYIDPPEGFFSSTALGVFMRCISSKGDSENTKVYYTIDGDEPTRGSSFTTYEFPYVHIDTPFKIGRSRVFKAVCTEKSIDGNTYRSELITRHYTIEGASRPDSYGFLVPGVNGGGYFTRITLEMESQARAQLAGGQEFADFNTTLGIGTYREQLRLIHLPSIDPDLIGFEGGFSMNTSSGSYGFLVPYHNGRDFFGKLVRIDLKQMEDPEDCMRRVRYEYYNNTIGPFHLERKGEMSSPCIIILDLTTLHPRARGFRRGFSSSPQGTQTHASADSHGYLSPGQFDVAIEFNAEHFALVTTRAIPLQTFQQAFGGYSGGFKDGPWACLNPFRSFYGPIGGVRSELEVDKQHLRPYMNSVVVCIHDDAWKLNMTEMTPAMYGTTIRSFDLGDVQPDLRGFSDALRVGRYVYFCPLSYNPHSYAYKLVRMDLGVSNVIDALDATVGGAGILDIVDVLDLTQKSPDLAGFSGFFSSGKYLFLVPWRAEHEPYNGQRGHGLVARVDMNIFDAAGIDILDLTTATRSQIPSIPDSDLRGFWGGFASGKYGIFVPFYNAVFSGKVGRMNVLAWNDIQELDLAQDRVLMDVLKGFRGGFVSQWQGKSDAIE